MYTICSQSYCNFIPIIGKPNLRIRQNEEYSFSTFIAFHLVLSFFYPNFLMKVAILSMNKKLLGATQSLGHLVQYALIVYTLLLNLKPQGLCCI